MSEKNTNSSTSSSNTNIKTKKWTSVIGDDEMIKTLKYFSGMEKNTKMFKNQKKMFLVPRVFLAKLPAIPGTGRKDLTNVLKQVSDILYETRDKKLENLVIQCRGTHTPYSKDGKKEEEEVRICLFYAPSDYITSSGNELLFGIIFYKENFERVKISEQKEEESESENDDELSNKKDIDEVEDRENNEKKKDRKPILFSISIDRFEGGETSFIISTVHSFIIASTGEKKEHNNEHKFKIPALFNDDGDCVVKGFKQMSSLTSNHIHEFLSLPEWSYSAPEFVGMSSTDESPKEIISKHRDSILRFLNKEIYGVGMYPIPKNTDDDLNNLPERDLEKTLFVPIFDPSTGIIKMVIVFRCVKISSTEAKRRSNNKIKVSEGTYAMPVAIVRQNIAEILIPLFSNRFPMWLNTPYFTDEETRNREKKRIEEFAKKDKRISSAVEDEKKGNLTYSKPQPKKTHMPPKRSTKGTDEESD